MQSTTSAKAATDLDRLVGLRITLLRKTRGLSQTALGEAVGVTFQQIQKYERGQNRVGAGRLQGIAAALDAPVAAFFDGADKQVETGLTILSEPGALDLLRAYAQITDPVLRTALINTARQFAQAAVQPQTEVA